AETVRARLAELDDKEPSIASQPRWLTLRSTSGGAAKGWQRRVPRRPDQPRCRSATWAPRRDPASPRLGAGGVGGALEGGGAGGRRGARGGGRVRVRVGGRRAAQGAWGWGPARGGRAASRSPVTAG